MNKLTPAQIAKCFDHEIIASSNDLNRDKQLLAKEFCKYMET